MQFRPWGIRLALGFVFCIGALGCHITDTFLAQATVAPTRTRTVKPTFTPISLPTLTPIPPTSTTAPSPTLRPTVRPATKPPPTKPPVVAASVPTQPPKSSYEFSFMPGTCPAVDPDAPCNNAGGVLCHHSGSKHIKVLVFNDYRDPNSQRQGGKVRFSGSPDGAPMNPDEVTQWNGIAEKTLSADQDPPTTNDGTYFAWVLDDNGKRISEMSPPIRLNAKSTDSPDFCTIALVVFAAGK